MIRLVTMITALLLPVAALAGDMTVTPAKTPIAKPVTARIEARLAPGEQAAFPETVPLPGGAEPVSATINPREQAPDGGVIHSAEYVFEMYKVGPAEVPQIEYTVTGPDGEQRTQTAGPAPFEVVSVRNDPETAGTLKDIRPPVTTELRPSKYILPALLALAVIAALAYLYHRWRNRREIPAPAPPPLPAHEVAFSELDALSAEGLCARGAYQEHFYRLSEIMRRYVENRYLVPALESTTSELKRRLDERFEDRTTRNQLFRLLEACDLVKFAKAAPSPANAEESVRRAREWVEATRPAEREEEAA